MLKCQPPQKEGGTGTICLRRRQLISLIFFLSHTGVFCVIPAQAGIQTLIFRRVDGMSGLDSRIRGNDGDRRSQGRRDGLGPLPLQIIGETDFRQGEDEPL